MVEMKLMNSKGPLADHFPSRSPVSACPCAAETPSAVLTWSVVRPGAGGRDDDGGRATARGSETYSHVPPLCSVRS